MMLLSSGILGTATGVWLFTLLRELDQLDLVIGLSYVTLLTAVGALMINESVQAELRARKGQPATLRRPGSHNWIHGLPFKLRFKRSKIYVSAIPVWAIGFTIGFIGAILGIGGGFLLVPMLIYFLRAPPATRPQQLPAAATHRSRHRRHRARRSVPRRFCRPANAGQPVS